jgi:hypothetical protein
MTLARRPPRSTIRTSPQVTFTSPADAAVGEEHQSGTVVSDGNSGVALLPEGTV